MNISKTSRIFIQKIILVGIVLPMVAGCNLGKRETQPTLTSLCNIDWKQQAKLLSFDLPDPNGSDGLNVLVWNIHDRVLPGSIFKAHSEDEVACIGKLAKLYDLVLFQEAYVRPVQIAAYTNHDWADHPFFSGGGGDWWPLRVVCEICLTPGLLMLAQEKPDWVHGEPYRFSAGLLTKRNRADNAFSKGFQLMKFPGFWMLNSHMDAGRGKDSRKARKTQAWRITVTLKRYVPSNAPLLIGMDSNLKCDRKKEDGGEDDEEVLQMFLEDNGLTLINQDGPDIIAVRNLHIENPQMLPLKEGGPMGKKGLSDHNALSVVVYPSTPPDPTTIKAIKPCEKKLSSAL